VLCGCRCEFDSTYVLLVNVFDQTAASYQKLLQTQSHTDNELALREGERKGKSLCREWQGWGMVLILLTLLYLW